MLLVSFRSQNLSKAPFDSASAMSALGVEHLVIFFMSRLQPRPDAMAAIASTIVAHSRQDVLYPLHQKPTDPALSTHIFTG